MSVSLSAPHIVLHRSAFNTFLGGDRDIQQINNWINDPSFSNEKTIYKVYTLWEKAKIIFQILTLRVIGSLGGLLGAKSLAQRCSIYISHLELNIRSIHMQRIFSDALLVSSRNLPRKEDHAFYTQRPIPRSAQGEHVKQLSIRGETGEIQFFNNNGICDGMSNWFIYLYLKTKSPFVDPTMHLHAVGKIFEKGGPEQAVFLQNFPDSPLLYRHKHIQEDTDKAKALYGAIQVAAFDKAGLYCRLVLQHVFKKDHPYSEKIEKIEALPPGAYKVGVEKHAMVYIKESKELGFLFDPNCGVIRLSGADHAHTLLQYPEMKDSDTTYFDLCELAEPADRHQQPPPQTLPQPLMPAPYSPHPAYPQQYHWAR